MYAVRPVRVNVVIQLWLEIPETLKFQEIANSWIPDFSKNKNALRIEWESVPKIYEEIQYDEYGYNIFYHNRFTTFL